MRGYQGTGWGGGEWGGRGIGSRRKVGRIRAQASGSQEQVAAGRSASSAATEFAPHTLVARA
eukprot:scaffold2192_cov90-Isochrysis_galbana.AAC.1